MHRVHGVLFSAATIIPRLNSSPHSVYSVLSVVKNFHHRIHRVHGGVFEFINTKPILTPPSFCAFRALRGSNFLPLVAQDERSFIWRRLNHSQPQLFLSFCVFRALCGSNSKPQNAQSAWSLCLGPHQSFLDLTLLITPCIPCFPWLRIFTTEYTECTEGFLNS
jgi:hypothetical protein